MPEKTAVRFFGKPPPSQTNVVRFTGLLRTFAMTPNEAWPLEHHLNDFEATFIPLTLKQEQLEQNNKTNKWVTPSQYRKNEALCIPWSDYAWVLPGYEPYPGTPYAGVHHTLHTIPCHTLAV